MKSMYRKIIYIILIGIMAQGLSARGELMRSLILPGWGELKMQENKRAKIFMSTDLAVIATYFLGKSFNGWYIDKYTAYGTLHADANMSGKNYAFIVNMSNYDSMEDYNHNMMIHHNANYFDDIYEDPSYYWQWDSTENRINFNDMRESSLIAEKFTEFAVAGLIINRVASAIDVLYLKNSKSGIDLNAFLIPQKNDGVSLNISFSIK